LRVNQVRKKEELSDEAKKGGCSNLREQVIWRTPDAHCDRGPSSEKRMKMKLEKGMPISLNDQVAHPDLMWPTPSSRDYKGGSGTVKEKDGKYYRQSDTTGTKFGVRLDALVEYQEKQKMFPTPNSSPNTISQTVEATLSLRERERKQGQLMEAVVDRMYPTPAARDHKDVGENTDYQKLADKSKLAGVVMMEEQRMWPTPNASDNRDRGNLSDPAIQRRIALGKQVNLSMAVKDEPKKGTLNPEWVEWLMGYPPGWTDITDSNESLASQE